MKEIRYMVRGLNMALLTRYAGAGCSVITARQSGQVLSRVVFPSLNHCVRHCEVLARVATQSSIGEGYGRCSRMYGRMQG
jgi:hypothetical protein